MKYLDFRTKAGSPFNETRSQIARFSTKKEAQRFAKQSGWRLGDVERAADRFFAYWVVCQCIGNDLRFLDKGGNILDVSHVGYF